MSYSTFDKYKQIINNRVLILDTETTGLPIIPYSELSPECIYPDYTNMKSYDNSRIVQVSYYYTEKYNPKEKYELNSFVIKPHNYIITDDNLGTKYHNITREEIKKGQTLQVILETKLRPILENCDYIIGYNVFFDINILLNELCRLDKYKNRDNLINNILEHKNSKNIFDAAILASQMKNDDWTTQRIHKYQIPSLNIMYKHYFGRIPHERRNSNIIALHKIMSKLFSNIYEYSQPIYKYLHILDNEIINITCGNMKLYNGTQLKVISEKYSTRTSKTVYFIEINIIIDLNNIRTIEEFVPDEHNYILTSDPNFMFKSIINIYDRKISDNNLKVISFNMNYKNKKFINEQSRQIKSLSPDIVFLQECSETFNITDELTPMSIDYINDKYKYIELCKKKSHIGFSKIFVNTSTLINNINSGSIDIEYLSVDLMHYGICYAIVKSIKCILICCHLIPSKSNENFRKIVWRDINNKILNKYADYNIIVGGDMNMRDHENKITKTFDINDIYVLQKEKSDLMDFNDEHYYTYPNNINKDENTLRKFRFDRFYVRGFDCSKYDVIDTLNSDHKMIYCELYKISKSL